MHENAFEIVVGKKAAILSRPQCVNARLKLHLEAWNLCVSLQSYSWISSDFFANKDKTNEWPF